MSISYSCTHHIVKLGIKLDTCVPKIIWKKYLSGHEHHAIILQGLKLKIIKSLLFLILGSKIF